MRLCVISLSLACLTLSTSGAAKNTPIASGSYCAKEPVTANFGNGETAPLGDFLMQMTVTRSNRGYAVEFWNVMPDNPQILSGGAEGEDVKVHSNGDLTFRFIDGWENRGVARITPGGRISLEVVEYAPDNQIGRNYGDYELTRETCGEKEFTGEVQR